jgi:hypothetical protein
MLLDNDKIFSHLFNRRSQDQMAQLNASAFWPSGEWLDREPEPACRSCCRQFDHGRRAKSIL